MTIKHPTFETLLDFLEDRLSKATSDQIATHLVLPCSTCQSEIEGMRDILQLLKNQRLSEPSSVVVQRAIQLFRRFYERPSADERPHLIARLLFDDLLVFVRVETQYFLTPIKTAAVSCTCQMV